MTATTARAPFAGPNLWVPGDWNAFFGLIHGEAIGFGSSPQVAAGYAIVAIILYACAKKAFIVPSGAVAHEEPAL